MTVRTAALPRSERHTLRNRKFSFFVTMAALTTVIASTTMPTPFYGAYSRELRLSNLQVTEVYAIYAFGIVAALVLFNSFSGAFGRRPLLLIGLACCLASDIVFLDVRSIGCLYAARVLSGLAAGVFMGTATVAALELAPEPMKKHATVWATAATVFGLSLGPVYSGIITGVSAHPERDVYLGHLVVAAAAVLALLASAEPLPRDRRVPFAWSPPVPPSRARREFFGLSLIGSSGLAAFGLLAGLTPAILGQIYSSRSGPAAGLIVGGAFAASAVSQLLLRDIAVPRGMRAGVTLVCAGLAILALGVLTKSEPVYVTAAVTIGLGQGLTMSRVVRVVSRSVDAARRVGVVNFFYVVVYTGAAIPVIAVPFLEDLAGLANSTYLFCGFSLVLCLAGRLLTRDGAASPQECGSAQGAVPARAVSGRDLRW
ncbi:MFS transporter [Actinomadura macrotermitis]|uniref:Major facilitator superfamily (MFS) profile domain-containing protein n=1 Tax=Actinomadura macrotermitis TaxID=2585200 RepID=A0A7K0BW81_9ACTN|nr:MFS transporter [Actinomadura macrotermitis]MQY05429.1 hypothetical protein [Actinomadura macrotermitis]